MRRRNASSSPRRTASRSPGSGARSPAISRKATAGTRRRDRTELWVGDEFGVRPRFYPVRDIAARTAEEGGTTMADRPDRSAFGAPPPDPELKRLEPLLGTWTTQGHTHDSVLGPGVQVTSTETFRWLDGGYFLVQEYATTFGDEPTQRGVAYWGYDAETGRFRIIFFSNNGPFTEEGNRYEGQVAEGSLTFLGPARYQYELDEQGKIKTNADGTISVAWWLRGEQGEWKSWMDNTFSKTRD